ncbi:MAG: hypothetical protein PVJ63_00515 [Thioalkalispiraceae bacterium]|jgi:hypothetical protein
MNETPLVEIIPPPLPVEPLNGWLWSALALAVAVTLIGLYAWYHSPKLTALRALRRIAHKINSTTQLKLLAFEICTTIKKRYALTHLDDIVPDNSSRWEAYRQRLNQACFAHTQPDEKLLRALVDEACYWVTCRDIKHD